MLLRAGSSAGVRLYVFVVVNSGGDHGEVVVGGDISAGLALLGGRACAFCAVWVTR